MKEQITQKIKKAGKQGTKKMAEYYANVVCPLVVYQPKLNESVKKLRKF